MSPTIGKFLKLYETSNLIDENGVTGNRTLTFTIQTGSRLVLSLYTKNISGGAQINVTIKNRFSLDHDGNTVLSWSTTTPGYTTRVLSDIHNHFEVIIDVIGGSADFAFGVTVLDNALATRIENAVIEAALSHIAGIDGKYDSVRVGDGIDELQVRKAFQQADDGSVDIHDIGHSRKTRIKHRLFCSPDLKKQFTFADIDGVWRVSSIVFTSVELNTIMAPETVTLTRTFTYLAADPYTLDKTEDNLTVA